MIEKLHPIPRFRSQEIKIMRLSSKVCRGCNWGHRICLHYRLTTPLTNNRVFLIMAYRGGVGGARKLSISVCREKAINAQEIENNLRKPSPNVILRNKRSGVQEFPSIKILTPAMLHNIKGTAILKRRQPV